MGQFDRITSVKDLPADKIMIANTLKKQQQLNEAGIKVAKPKNAPKEFTVPDELIAALKKNKKANAAFEKFPSLLIKENILYGLPKQKTEATKNKRIETAIEWMK
jgi:uncharacterized protein YdeI (YjbR/CyaY-like superfamily)